MSHGHTTEIKIVKYECPEKSDFDIIFIDTPGFDDTEWTGAEILEMIADWLNKTYAVSSVQKKLIHLPVNHSYERKFPLTGILYFHRITDKRMAAPPPEDIVMFKELSKTDNFHHIILTTTMWDKVKPAVGAGREAELRSKYWKIMIDQSSVTARFHGTQASGWDILDYFVQHTNARHAALLQKGMSEMKEQWVRDDEQMLYTELEVLVYKQQATIKKIRDETKLHADAAILGPLKAKYDDLRTQLTTIVDEIQSLNLPLGKRISRLTRDLMPSLSNVTEPPPTYEPNSTFPVGPYFNHMILN